MPSKKTATNQSTANKFDWIESINVLNEYLPDEFPRLEKVPNTDLIDLYQEGKLILSFRKDGTLVIRADPKSITEAAFKYIVLNQFAREYSSDNTQDFIYANLPFQFSATHFIDRYKQRVYSDQMEEMLLALGVDANTITRYLRHDKFKFKLRVHQKFARDFIAYAGKQAGRASFPFDELLAHLRIKESQLKNWVSLRYFKDSGIIIDTSNRFVNYRRRKK